MLEELDAKPSADESKEGSDDQGEGKRKATDSDAGQGSKKKRKTSSTGVGFKPMAQRVAAKWKALDRKALAHYEDLAADDLQRDKKEMNEWREKKRVSGKTSPKDDLDDDDDEP